MAHYLKREMDAPHGRSDSQCVYTLYLVKVNDKTVSLITRTYSVKRNDLLYDNTTSVHILLDGAATQPLFSLTLCRSLLRALICLRLSADFRRCKRLQRPGDRLRPGV